MNPRRLYRCREDRQIAGVASGMAEYLGLDPTVVRILWILSVFFGGFTILLYIVLAFVVPLEPIGAAHLDASADALAGSVEGGPAHEHRARGESRFGFGLGVLLVVFGSIALLGSILPGWIASMTLGPAFIFALGVALVLVAARRPSPEA